MNILALLVEQGYLAEADVDAIVREADEKQVPVEEILAQRGIDAASVLSARSRSTNVPSYALAEGTTLGPEVLAYIPEESAKHYQAVPLGVEDGALLVGMLDPDNIEALDALNFISAKNNKPFKAYLITQEDFERILGMYQGLGGEVNRALTSVESEDDAGGTALDLNSSPRTAFVASEAPRDSAASDPSPTVTAREDAPVSKIVATMIRNAVEGRASDIHIENTGEKVRVRFRVDGVLHTSILLPTQVHRAVVSRIKILASLKLDERRKPQDGRFSATLDGRKVDFRVSTFPTRYGEKVVMRILDSETGINKLEKLGLADEHMALVRTAIEKPYGMILVTGPTGSGKSTTLYSMLAEVDTEGKNVLSLEDPVEYNIPGVSQSQVRADIGYTFASGLRSILRQDPDVIMVGEIRDKETAQLAVQAALTGHLVLSTLHTNTALGAVPRLIDMGVDPYLIAPTLELLVGQRLVRRMCPDSGRKIPVTGTVSDMLNEQFADLPEQYKKTLPLDQEYIWGMQATGDCPTGTRGRTAVHEMVAIDREFEDAILNGADENKLYDLARKQGFLTMRESGIIKAFNREIPFEEVNTLGGGIGLQEEETEDAGHQQAEGTSVQEIAV